MRPAAHPLGTKVDGRTYRLLVIVLAAALTGNLPLLAQNSGQPKPDPSFPFSTEIEDFTKADSAVAGNADAHLFLGSSSIRLWNTPESFPNFKTVNRGFGGATTPDVLHYYDRLRPRVSPRSFIVYVGENDLSAGALPEKVASDIFTLLRKLHADYPKARIACLSLKPSPIRWTSYPKMQLVNHAIAQNSRAIGFDYLEVGELLLAPDGLPDATLFRPDGLHLNARGYRLWSDRVTAWLQGSPSPPRP